MLVQVGADNYSRNATLFLALTRPALMFGVPFECMMANLLGTFFIGAELSGPSYWRCPIVFWSMGIFVHLALRKLTSSDYYWFRTILIWLGTIHRRELSSLPSWPARRGRELGSCV